MKVLLLAAGRSTRLQPIKDKLLLEFLGKPLIQHQIEQLLQHGYKDIIIAGGNHNLHHLKNILPQFADYIQIIEQESLDDGMAGAVLSAAAVIKEGPLLIVNGNDLIDSEAFTLIEKARAQHADVDGFILAKKMEEYFPGGYLKVEENGLIKGIIEKPGVGNEPSNLVNIVVHYFKESQHFFKAVAEATTANDDRYEVALDNLIQRGAAFKAIPYGGFWQPIKYPWHVLKVMNYFLGMLAQQLVQEASVEIADTAVIRGPVYLAEGVKIFDQAIIVGPVYIGKNSVVASHSLVRQSHIGNDCVIGYGSEIARSYLGNKVWTHTNYVGDSIIGNDCSFGSGTVTGNLRFDEGNIQVMIKGEKVDSGFNKFGIITGDKVRTGINVSLMPGVKIGSNSIIGAGICINKDIEDNMFVYGKTELIIKENNTVIDGDKRQELKKKLL